MDIRQILHVSLAQHLPAWVGDQDLSSCNWAMSSWRFCSVSAQNDEAESRVPVEMSLPGVGAAGCWCCWVLVLPELGAGGVCAVQARKNIYKCISTYMHIWMAERYTQTWGAIVHLCRSHPSACTSMCFLYIYIYRLYIKISIWVCTFLP